MNASVATRFVELRVAARSGRLTMRPEVLAQFFRVWDGGPGERFPPVAPGRIAADAWWGGESSSPAHRRFDHQTTARRYLFCADPCSAGGDVPSWSRSAKPTGAVLAVFDPFLPPLRS